LDSEQLEALLIKLKAAGLVGIEGYYTEYTSTHIAQYRALADKLNLALSGGSDFHATMKPHIEIGVGTGNLRIPYFVYENLKRIKDKQ
jgi:predicted metal-dependent phosphoesterase TrpH